MVIDLKMSSETSLGGITVELAVSRLITVSFVLFSPSGGGRGWVVVVVVMMTITHENEPRKRRGCDYHPRSFPSNSTHPDPPPQGGEGV